jgi:hypothetical protein
MNGIFGAVNRVFAARSKIQTMPSQRLARTPQKGPFPKIKNPRAPDHFWNIVPNPQFQNSASNVERLTTND